MLSGSDYQAGGLCAGFMDDSGRSGRSVFLCAGAVRDSRSGARWSAAGAAVFDHLLVCTVTGVAPFVSYVRTLFADWKKGAFAGDHHLFLLNGASRSWEFGYRDELERFAGQASWFAYM